MRRCNVEQIFPLKCLRLLCAPSLHKEGESESLPCPGRRGAGRAPAEAAARPGAADSSSLPAPELRAGLAAAAAGAGRLPGAAGPAPVRAPLLARLGADARGPWPPSSPAQPPPCQRTLLWPGRGNAASGLPPTVRTAAGNPGGHESPENLLFTFSTCR